MFSVINTLSLVFLAAAIAVPLIILNIRLAPRLGLIDWPKARGMTEDQIPLVGHSLALITIGVMLLLNHLYHLSPWFITTAVLMGIMGHLDDRRPMPAVDKMLFQLICVGVVIFLEPQIRANIWDKYGLTGTLLAGVFIVGLVNAVNFIDGIDGLAGIVIASGALGFVLLHGSAGTSFANYTLASLILGMMIPFLFFNVRKKRGFLGNIGSYFLSYCLAVMHVSLPIDSPDAISRLSLSGLCFLIPIADSLMVVASRLVTLRSPFQPDKGHLHHRLIQTSIPLPWILFNFAVIELGGITIAVLLARSSPNAGGILPLFVCVSHMVITTVLILLIEKASRRRLQAYFQRLDTGQPIYFLKYEFKKANGQPISSTTLNRLEARVSAEIRVTDLCFSEKPNTLFVTLKTLPEPLKGISNRLDTIFQAEKVVSSLVVDQGEFVKVSRGSAPAERKTA